MTPPTDNPDSKRADTAGGARGSPPAKPAGLLRSGSIVGAMTLLSRILGFVRDQVLAILFGASLVTDVFLVAWKIPNFMRKLFAEGAFAQAFVPIFSEYREKRSHEELRTLAASVAGTLSVILLIITTLGVMFAPALIMVFAPGYHDTPDQFDLAVQMLRITFPYLICASLLAYAGSILNTFGRFAIPSLTPVILNICMIIAALWFSPMFEEPIVALAWGVLIAGLFQLLLQIPFLRQIHLLPRPRWAWKDSGVRRILKLMAPVLFGSSVAQINVLLDTVIASFLTIGSLSWLYYSDRLVQFPLGILGVAIGTVILPRLSAQFTVQSDRGYQDTLSWAIRITLFIGLPASAGLLLLAGPMLSTLFEYGRFTAHDTRMATYSLTAYAFGLPAYLLIKVLLPAFFSRQDTRTPVRIGIISLVSNMVLNLILVIPMVMADFVAPHMALAIASSTTAWQQAILLYRRLARDNIYRLPREEIRQALRILPALVIMTLTVLWLTPDDWSSMSASERAVGLLGIIGAAIASYAVSLFIIGVRPAEFTAKPHDNP